MNRVISSIVGKIRSPVSSVRSEIFARLNLAVELSGATRLERVQISDDAPCYVFDQIRDSNAIVSQYSSMLRTSNRCAAQILLVRNTNRYTEQEGYVHPSVRIRAIENNNFPTIQSDSARARDDSYQRFINSKPGERSGGTRLRLGASDRSSATEERAGRCSVRYLGLVVLLIDDEAVGQL